MDRYLIDYLNSGQAWVLVGSGPSLQMGYPSWEHLARTVVPWVKTELVGADTRAMEEALARRDWPGVLGEASRLIGDETRVLQFLRPLMRPRLPQGEIYDLITRWPVPVYLTTNWDDEIQKHLAKVGETYLSYSGSADHLSLLIPGLQGAVFTLHGDLRSSSGLVMTADEYAAIENRPEWEHWRVKMNAVFQMNRVIVIGHSLSDRHIRHVLAAAKKGAGIERPVVWIAPDANDDLRREMLMEHRIRVVSYHNRDGSHSDLLQMLRDVSRFVVPRERIRIGRELEHAIPSGSACDTAAATALLVYSRVAESDPVEKKRIRLIVAAIESAIPDLATREAFTLGDALAAAGWPSEYPLGQETAADVAKEVEAQGLLSSVGVDVFRVSSQAQELARLHTEGHGHLRERFRRAVARRSNLLFPSLGLDDHAALSVDIERALLGCVRAEGFALASSTFSRHLGPDRRLAPSILDFLNGASAQYPDLLHRRAFLSTIIDMLVNPTSAETEYLGALVGGYCAYNYLGVYGDVALERIQHAKETVWLVDSDFLISALAVSASTHYSVSFCLGRLRYGNVRLFTLETLFEEAYRHLMFARRVIEENGAGSQMVLYAAQGQPPYRKTNQFLEGFIRWQSAGNAADWEAYISFALGAPIPSRRDVRRRVESLGVTVVEFQDWPGFEQALFNERDRLKEAVMERRRNAPDPDGLADGDMRIGEDPARKATPEAEALIVIGQERSGAFHALSSNPQPGAAWFISHTAFLNTLGEDRSRITWRPESFLRFTEGLSTAGAGSDSDRADRFFQALIWNCTHSGLSVLDEKTIEAVFGSATNNYALQLGTQREHYSRILAAKYGEDPLDVVARIARPDQPLAAMQLANEAAQAEKERAVALAQEAERLRKGLKEAEQKLARVGRYQKKVAEREKKRKKTARRMASRAKTKKKRR